MRRIIFRMLFMTLLLSIATVSYSQQKRYKFRASKFMRAYLDNYGDYTFGTPWVDSSLVVVIDMDDKRILLYSDPLVVFEITSKPTTYKDNVFSFIKWESCVDVNGARCSVRLMMPINKEDGLMYIYIDYSNVTKVFLVNSD